MRLSIILIFSIVFCSSICFATQTLYNKKEIQTINRHLLENIVSTQSTNSRLGAVMASPTKKSAQFTIDYKIHWTRDAAIVMSQLISSYQSASATQKTKLLTYFKNYIVFEARLLQKVNQPGEPKYTLDGKLWAEPWSRPQNDGPALRAINMIAIYKLLENDRNYQTIAFQLIKQDLSYLINNWQTKTYDLWEELEGESFFFNKMVQRKAFVLGSQLFAKLGMPNDAKKYADVVWQINQSLKKHWVAKLGYLTASLEKQDIKGGGLNASTLLAVLYGYTNDTPVFDYDDDKVISTVLYLQTTFAHLYKINIKLHTTLIGRYFNDVYDGNQFVGGNPWVLTTNALAEFYYRLARKLLQKGRINVTEENENFFEIKERQIITREKQPLLFDKIITKLIQRGDHLLLTIKSISYCNKKNDCLHFSEQIDRVNGQPIGARDLTWGYATLLMALQARDEVTSARTASNGLQSKNAIVLPI